MTNHTQFINKKNIPSSRSIIKLLQNKFGSKTPLHVSVNPDGTIHKIEIQKILSVQDKKWVTDKYPELE